MNAQLTEIMRLITNLIRIGTVTEVDRDTSTMAPLVGWKSTEQAVTTTYSSVSASNITFPPGGYQKPVLQAYRLPTVQNAGRN